jgi:hypothetical protein
VLEGFDNASSQYALGAVSLDVLDHLEASEEVAIFEDGEFVRVIPSFSSFVLDFAVRDGRMDTALFGSFVDVAASQPPILA